MLNCDLLLIKSCNWNEICILNARINKHIEHFVIYTEDGKIKGGEKKKRANDWDGEET